MTPELAAAAFSLTNNQISDVIELPYGFYLVKLVAKVPPHKLAFTDKVDETTVAESIKTYLIQQQTVKLAPAYVANLKKEDDVQILDPNLKALAAEAEAAASNAPATTTPEP
jgi:parvulin-like peptidyl-prolyl isomerase